MDEEPEVLATQVSVKERSEQPLGELVWKGDKHPLLLGLNLVGRKKKNVHICLDQKSVSDKHASISIDSLGNCTIVDLMSTNGTFVENKSAPEENRFEKVVGGKDVQLPTSKLLLFETMHATKR
jgi:hypothetical protein